MKRDEQMIDRLRRLYVKGEIEIEAFEERLDRILRGEPMPVDCLAAQADDIVFGPGMVIPVNGDPRNVIFR